MKIKDIPSWVLFPNLFEIVSVGTLVCMMVTMVDIVWVRLSALCLAPTRARWSAVCCHGVGRPSKIGQQRVVCLTLLLAKFALCASAALKLAREALGTQLALRIRACRPSTPAACHAAWWLARKRRPREPRLQHALSALHRDS